MKLSSLGAGAFMLGSSFGFIGGLIFIAKQVGFGWAVVAFFLAPATIPLAPIYKWVAMGDASLFLWSYGLAAVGVAVLALSKD